MNIELAMTLLNYIDTSGISGPVTWEDIADFCDGFIQGVEEAMEDATDAQY